MLPPLHFPISKQTLYYFFIFHFWCLHASVTSRFPSIFHFHLVLDTFVSLSTLFSIYPLHHLQTSLLFVWNRKLFSFFRYLCFPFGCNLFEIDFLSFFISLKSISSFSVWLCSVCFSICVLLLRVKVYKWYVYITDRLEGCLICLHWNVSIWFSLMYIFMWCCLGAIGDMFLSLINLKDV